MIDPKNNAEIGFSANALSASLPRKATNAMANIPPITVERNSFFQPISTAYQLVGFLDGLSKGLDGLTADNIDDDCIERYRVALAEAMVKADKVAAFLSEIVDDKGE